MVGDIQGQTFQRHVPTTTCPTANGSSWNPGDAHLRCSARGRTGLPIVHPPGPSGRWAGSPSTGPQPATVRDHSHAPNQASLMLSDSHPLTAPYIAEAVGPLPTGVAQGKHHLNHILGSHSCRQTEGPECSPFRQRVHHGGRAALSSDTTR